MLQTSGVPGSVLRMRLGSVTAGRSFAQIASGDSSRPIVLPIDFDIFAWPSSPMMRRVAVSSGFGSGRYVALSNRSAFQLCAQSRARELEMLHLILAHRHEVGAIQQNVRSLQHRIVEQPRVHALLALRLVLELRLALELTERRDGVEDPRELGMFRHLRLHEQRRLLGVEARGEQRHGHLPRAARAAPRARTRRDRVIVDDADRSTRTRAAARPSSSRRRGSCRCAARPTAEFR